jgi:RND family efflux transporter MFP subunit
LKLARCSFAFVLLCLGTLIGCNNSKATKAQQGPQAFPVKVETVHLQKVNESTEFVATVRSRDAAVLQPQVEGQITRIFVKSGQHVREGERLIQIDLQKQAATVRTSEANAQSRTAQLELNKIQLERTQKLYSQGVVSKQELDQAQTAYNASVADVEALRASVNEQKQQLRYYTVEAPQAGIVGDIPVRVGDRVATTTVLTTVDSGKGLEAYISIPAERSGDIHIGTPVELIAEDGSVVTSKITFVSPQVDAQNQLLLTKAAITDPQKFRNNQVIHAKIVWKQIEAPLVSVLAVSRQAGELFVFVAEQRNGQTVASQKPVTASDTVGNDYVISKGLSGGEQLIVSNTGMLVDGMPVVPMSAPPAGAANAGAGNKQ